MGACAFQISHPKLFDFSRPNDWPLWSRRFERFRHASGLSEKDEVTQVHTLIYAMGDQADDILRSFGLSEAEEKNYATVLGKFQNYFVKRKNTIFERAKFNRRAQEDGEPVDDFIMDLYRLAEHCEYGTLRDEMIRDRIVVGLRNAALSEKLQMDADLDLDKAIKAARQSESIKEQQTLLRSGFREERAVGAVSKQPYNRPKRKSKRDTPPSQQSQSSSPSNSCSRCGRFPGHPRQQCPARDETCHKCGKRGHFQAMCRSKPGGRKVSSVEVNDQEAFMGVVQDSEHNNPWVITLLLNGKPQEFKIDTGADVSVVPHEMVKSIPGVNLQKSQKTLNGPNRRALPVKGQFSAKLQYGEREVIEEVFVVQRLSQALLGRPAIESLGLVCRVNTVKTKEDLRQQFPKLFNGLGKLEGDYSIHLRKDATPYALTTPRRVAIPMLPKVKAELERMEKMGVISRVQEPTEWCSGMVVVPKSGDRVRICVDLTRLNESVCRERHQLPAVEQTLAQLTGARVFTKLDANSGFWQIPLAKESALLTTFITPYGRFCFNRLPFGITSAPEHFQRRMSEILQDVEGAVCLMDDILVHGKTQEEHDGRLTGVLRQLQEAGLTLNEKKCEFSQSRVKFLGQIVDQSGVQPDPEKVSAILQMRTPTSVSDIRRFLGMTNQLSKFSPDLANKTKPLRDLLSSKSQWCWEEPQQRAFAEVKEAVSRSPVLALFNPSLDTTVSADASSYGLGAVLLQRQADGERRPVAYASRAMTPTEQRYAQIEKEALAITWACDRFTDYLMGLQFHVETDHKPLVPLFGNKRLDELPLRVQRFRMRMMRYTFSISHVPGKDLVMADTLSRAPGPGGTNQEVLLREEVEAYVDAVYESIPATEGRLEEIRKSQDEEHTLRLVKTYCQTGWPDRRAMPDLAKPFHSVASELTVEKGLLMRGSRVVIPSTLRKDMLAKLHEGHQGLTKCRERAKHSMWWPGLSSQLEGVVKSCLECLKHTTPGPEPLQPSSLPRLPWQKVGTDLFVWNTSTYLLVVDYFSRWIEIARLSKLTSEEVILHTSSVFARHGIPEVVVSDNGPQFSAASYAKFAQQYGFKHVTSSPHYPQGNGEAERAVKTVKSLLKKSGDHHLALLAYRSTPLACGYSPAQLLMSRNLRTTLPMVREQRIPKVVDFKEVKERDRCLKERQRQNYNQRHRTKDLPPLESGDTVWVPDRDSSGTVVSETVPRSHIVETSDGLFRRNRRHLVRLPTIPTQESEEEEPEETEPIVTPPVTQNTRVTRSQTGRAPGPPERLDPSWT